MTEALFAALIVVQTALLLWSHVKTRGFLNATPRIRTEASLDRYKDFVRAQMYMALGALGLLVPALILSVALVRKHGLFGLVVVLAANAVVFGFARYQNSWEVKARSLTDVAESLEPQYRRVSSTWTGKALPDF